MSRCGCCGPNRFIDLRNLVWGTSTVTAAIERALPPGFETASGNTRAKMLPTGGQIEVWTVVHNTPLAGGVITYRFYVGGVVQDSFTVASGAASAVRVPASPIVIPDLVTHQVTWESTAAIGGITPIVDAELRA